MGVLDHWHPVYRSRRLKAGGVTGVVVAGRPICLFRTQSGSVGALDDVCPHRRLRLSAGRVMGDRVECRYHGWQFDRCGRGESPGTPKMTACAEAFTAREAHGLIWVKSATSDPPFPDINPDGWFHLGTFEHVAPAPLELTVDNFTEIEHTATVHATFGYDLDRMPEVRVRVSAADDAVAVANVGPSKRLFRPFAWLLGVRAGDLFHDDWMTRFSPVYAVYDHYWTSPDGRREGMVRWRLYMFFWPIGPARTAVTSLVYAHSRYPGPTGGLRLARRLFNREFDREVRRDVDLLGQLADHSVGIGGMKLSRFDRVLGLHRERIDRIYRGLPAQPPARGANGRVPLTV